ncbi:MAG TPA: hypothetical protein VLH56_00405 [Dissulfurispiraceae bacterium]|nr:hypothetical protein [Dissulfurispiraceae bacterium]
MAKKPAYKQEKRKKELNRLKKQEEKRQKRLSKSGTGETEEAIQATGEAEPVAQEENRSAPQQAS